MQAIQQNNKVDIVNNQLYNKFVIQNTMDFMPEQSFKSTHKPKSKSPQQTLKQLIKKGLAYYTNPYSRPKSSKRIKQSKQSFSKISFKQSQKLNKQNHKSLELRNTQFQSFKNTNFLEKQALNKLKTSSSVFLCSKNHPTNQKNCNTKFRLKTQAEELRFSSINRNNNNNFSNSSLMANNGSNRYMTNKVVNKNDIDDCLPTSGQAFREFRNISEQTLNRLNVENERRNIKAVLFKKEKYEGIWKKYPVPPVSGIRENKGILKGQKQN